MTIKIGKFTIKTECENSQIQFGVYVGKEPYVTFDNISSAFLFCQVSNKMGR